MAVPIQKLILQTFSKNAFFFCIQQMEARRNKDETLA